MRQHCFRPLGLAVAFLVLASAAPCWASTVFVDSAATGANTGSSWANAFTDLQSALSAAVCGDEIWVADGIYRPTSGSDRTISFVLRSCVALYGGFAGGESGRNQRNWDAHKAILSGDLNGDDGPALFQNDAENSFHVVVGSGTDATAVLDGFVIESGHANGQPPHHDGAGVYVSGGSPTLRNLVVQGNRAENGYGGGMLSVSGSGPEITACEFLDNKAVFGGGMASSGPAQITNCLFARNRAVLGGGIFISIATTTLTNCTIANNTAMADSGLPGLGGGAYVYSGNVILNNSIASLNDPTDIEPFGAGVRNCTMVGGDPLFVDLAAGDFRLTHLSPAVDAGCSGYVPLQVLADLDLSPRFDDIPSATDTGTGTPPLVDQGAYELPFPRNRYLSFKPGPAGEQVALRVTLTRTGLGGTFSNRVGASWWVQAHISAEPPDIFRLGCSPHYQDWGSAPPVIHVRDDEVFPDSDYRIDAVSVGGAVNPRPVVVSTVSHWGDVAGPKIASGWTPPDGLVNDDDIDADVECFQGLPGVPPLASCDVHPAVPNRVVDALDITLIVDATQGYPYPFAAPVRCLIKPLPEEE